MHRNEENWCVLMAEPCSDVPHSRSFAYLDLLECGQHGVGWLSGTDAKHGIGIEGLFELPSAVFRQELVGMDRCSSSCI